MLTSDDDACATSARTSAAPAAAHLLRVPEASAPPAVALAASDKLVALPAAEAVAVPSDPTAAVRVAASLEASSLRPPLLGGGLDLCGGGRAAGGGEAGRCSACASGPAAASAAASPQLEAAALAGTGEGAAAASDAALSQEMGEQAEEQ